MQVPLGLITVPNAGTPVRITTTTQYLQSGIQASFRTAQAILVQTWKANTGQVFVGKSGMVKATGAGVIAVLGIPSTSALHAFGASNQLGPASIDIGELYLDADVNG